MKGLRLALAAALLAGCAATPPAGGPLQLRLIAFNDFHGNLESTGLVLPWPDPADRAKVARLAAGGAAPLAGLVRALRDGAPHSLVVSSGDLIGGTPLVSALFLHEPTIDVANRIGVDLAIPGNHEFDAGKDELLRVLGGGCRALPADAVSQSCAFDGRHEGARFPMFAANVSDSGGRTLFPPSVVKVVDGVKVGFIGAVTKVTPGIVVPSGVAGLRFGDEADAINAEAERLDAQGVRALVAVVHEGGDTGTPGAPLEWNDAGCPHPRGEIFDIVRRLSAKVDVVLSAHTHQGYRCVIDGRPVMQATALGRGVSVADLVIDRASGEIDRARSTHRNLPVLNERSDPALRQAILAAEPEPWASALRAAAPDRAVAVAVARVAAAAAPRAERPWGRIGGAFDRSGRTDSSAGRLIADAQWAATRAPDKGGAMFALMNPGGVRADLRCAGAAPCAVTYGQAFTMQPFGNNLVVMTLSGAQLLQMLEDQQRPGRDRPLLLIPSSGLRYEWHARAPHGQRVRGLTLDGRTVEPGARYRFTVNSFLADGGDGFTMLRQGSDRLGGELDIDALSAHLQTGPAPDVQARVTWVE
ncbi:MAG: bifunctional metallophosphatase/5'-nucleotidase [Rubrivivax sp.]